MSKNTNISELINYLSYDGSGNIVFNTVSSATTNTDKFLVSDTGVLKFRTAAQLLSDIGAQASGSYQTALSGTGFVKISGSTISYDNSTYATETYVGTAISNLVASSPATLDTLNELATALGSDPNFATTVATSIGTKQAQLNGTGFVKISGTTISYDSSTYLTTATASSTYLPLAGGTLTGPLTINYGGGHFTLVRNTFNTFSFGTGIGSGISGLVISDVTAGTNPLIIAQTTGNATFSGEVSVGSSLVLAAANPFIYGGTAVGGVGISNIGGQSYIKIHGASHATLANVIQFVNGSSTSFTVSSAGVTNFNSRVNINGAVDNASYALNVYGDATFNGTRATPAYIYAIRGGDDSKLILKAGSTAGYFSQIDVSGWNGTGTPAYIALNSGSGTGIYVKLGNNIGVGTVTPSAKLDVYAGADATSNTILWGQIIRNEGNGAATGYGSGLKLKLSSDGEPYKWAGIAAVAGTGYSNRTDLGLFTAATSTADATEKVRITGDGYFGINTITPLARLSIGSGSLTDTNVPAQMSSGGGGTGAYFGWNKNGSYGLLVGMSNGLDGWTAGVIRQITTDPLYFIVNNNIIAMNINSVGKVGINTTDFTDNGIFRVKLNGSSYTRVAAFYNTTGDGIPYITVGKQAGEGADSAFVLAYNIATNIGWLGIAGDSYGTGLFIKRGGNVGIGTTDFSDITFGSSALKIAGSRAALGLTSSGTISTIALVAGNNTATAMHMNFENTGAFRWYSYVSSGETFSLLGNGRLGLGVASPDARLHVGGPILVSNNSQTYRRAITCYGQTGTYSQVKVIFNKSSWGSVVYDIKLASAGASHHTAGGYYSNPGIGSHVNSINAGGLSMSFVSESQVGTQGQTWTFSGATMIHPIVTVDIGCGNGYQVNPDDIIVQFT